MALDLIVAGLLIFGGGELDTLVNAYLKERLSEYTRYTYEIVSVPQAVKQNKAVVEIDIVKQFSMKSGYGYIPVNLTTTEGQQTSAVITIKLRLYQNAFFTVRKIGRGEVLSPADVRYGEAEVSALRSEPLLDLASISLYQTKSAVPEGMVLEKRFVETIPLVQPGDIVTAYVMEGSVIISVKAEAKQSGSIGDVITIITEDKKTFKAEIENFNQVRIVK